MFVCVPEIVRLGDCEVSVKMESKAKAPANMGLRKITKPVISTDVMGNRNVEVRAVGAWVQPSFSQPSEGVLAAHEEEAKIKNMQREKEERLRKFKEDVKRRVRVMEKARKQQQIEKTYSDVEHERKVVKQSAFSSENIFPRKDNCVVQRNHSLTIKHSNKQSENLRSDSDTDLKAFHDQTNQVHKFTNQARRKLYSKQVITDDFVPDDLPGGVWKVSGTRDHPASRSTMEPEVIDLEEDIEHHSYPPVVIPTGEEYDSDSNLEKARLKMVHFDLEPSRTETRKERIDRRSTTTISGTQITRNVPHVPNIYAGVQTEEEKRRVQSQHATYRRLFMDIEREQVKENNKRHEHRKRIQRLKKEKEELRRQEEEESRRQVEPRDIVTGETSIEILAREIEQQKRLQDIIKQHEQKVKKSREMERYVEALRAQLREKITIKGIQLPPLCCCGETIWDTNPELCANNCVFYKNPRGFAKALQSLLVSCDVS